VTFDPLFLPLELIVTTSDAAWLMAMLDAERALANAEASAGVIPPHAAEHIAEHCRTDLYDIDELAGEGRMVGNPAEPLVRALRRAVGPEIESCVHWGATSQDIVDSAAMLVTSRALRLIDRYLGYAQSGCERLATDHRSTPITGRTLMQQAVPTTFGVTAAGWLTGLREAQVLVRHVRETRLSAQLGGAVGTLSVLGEQGPEVARLYAAELDLCEPPMPWHSNRVVIIEIAGALAAVASAAAKIASDVVLLSQTEVGEVSERTGGGSSTMPHKRNPTRSVLALANAAHGRTWCAALVGAAPHELERAAGSWHAEWSALTGAINGAGAAIHGVADIVGALQVNEERMRTNLDLTGGLILAERVAFAASVEIGLEQAHELVSDAAERATDDEGGFRGALLNTPGLGLSAEQIDAALDPTVGLEPAERLVDRVLEAGDR
jgi:3-carboxy-cis,cis-muconate cycloisomerase